MFGLESQHALTKYAFGAPEVGQRFSESYSFYMYVVAVEPDGRIVTREGSPPVTFPEGAERREYASADEWRTRFAYRGIEGYWVQFMDDGHDVTGWASPAEEALEEKANQ